MTVSSGNYPNAIPNINLNHGYQRNPEHRKSLLKDTQDELNSNKITMDITLI
jgi:hypothetical protein